MRSTPALLLTLLALAPAVALAHHGWSGYDSSKVLTLTGTIREAGYEHPQGATGSPRAAGVPGDLDTARSVSQLAQNRDADLPCGELPSRGSQESRGLGQ